LIALALLMFELVPLKERALEAKITQPGMFVRTVSERPVVVAI
jgi:hypothetical protein